LGWFLISLSIKNCRILHAGRLVETNIYIDDGKINHIGSFVNADKNIDANGKIVIPGLIDPHVHFREPGMSHKEDWKNGSINAASAGITTVLDMPNTSPPTVSFKDLKKKRKFASNSLVNYGFHFGATVNNMENIKELENEIASVKIFMGSSTGSLLINKSRELFEVLSHVDKLITVHAEDDFLIKYFSEQCRDEDSPEIHHEARANLCEELAITKIILFSRHFGNRLHICHVSTKEGLDQVIKAKNERLDLSCEVTPHHLFLTNEDVKELGNYGKMNPPLRSREDQVALWIGLRNGRVDIIATDHAPHLKKEKEQSYWKAPSGVPGVSTMLPLLLDAVNKGKLELDDVVRLTANNPARVFRIKDKGFIKPNYDADLVIIDMELKKEVNNEELNSKCGWSPFHGRVLKGWPVTTIINGNLVFDSGKVYDEEKGKEVEYSNE